MEKGRMTAVTMRITLRLLKAHLPGGSIVARRRGGRKGLWQEEEKGLSSPHSVIVRKASALWLSTILTRPDSAP